MINKLGVDWKAEEEEDLFFVPEVISPVYTSKGEIPNRSALYRDDKYISLVSGKYSLIPNKVVKDVIDDVYGFELDRKRSFNYKNKKFNIAYRLPSEIEKSVGGVDPESPLIPMVIAKNTYDGTSSWTFEFALYRLVCSNGLMMSVASKKLYFRHVGASDDSIGKIRVDLINRIGNLLEHSDDIVSFIQNMQTVSEINLQGNILGQYSPAMMMLYLKALQMYYGDARILGGDNDIVVSSIENIPEWVKKETETKRDISTLDRWEMKAEEAIRGYSEPVNNKWQVWQLLVNVAQSYLKKHNRMEESGRILRLINSPSI